MKKHPRHDALNKLRFLCQKTAEEFSRLTGVGYAQLVAVEQGRRELSRADAMLISAATGVDPAFNDDRGKSDLRRLDGTAYTETSLELWQKQDLPQLRDQTARLRSVVGLDSFEEVLIGNLREIMAAARVQGRDLAVAHLLQIELFELANRFGLGPSLLEWKEFKVTYSDPKPLTAKEKRETPEAVSKHTVTCSIHTAECEGLGRREKPDWQKLKKFFSEDPAAGAPT